MALIAQNTVKQHALQHRSDWSSVWQNSEMLLCAAQVMEFENRLQKASSDAVKKDDDHRKMLAAMQSQLANAAAAASMPAAAAAAAAAQAGQQPPPDAAAALANGGPPGGAVAADGSVLNNMRKQAAGLMQNLQSQAPGYARMLQDTLMGAPQAGAAAAANAMGGPEHVPQPAGARSTMSGMQETELERKTRELQVSHGYCAILCDVLLTDTFGLVLRALLGHILCRCV